MIGRGRTRTGTGLVPLLLMMVSAAAMAMLPAPSSAAGAKSSTQVQKDRGGYRSKRGKIVRASWYGGGFHGRRAANGKPYDARQLTAAHRSWQFGSRVRVRNPRNGKAVVVEITDRGPFVPGREIDLSYAAAAKLGILRSGVAAVEVQLLDELGHSKGDFTGTVMVASAPTSLGLPWPRAILK